MAVGILSYVISIHQLAPTVVIFYFERDRPFFPFFLIASEGFSTPMNTSSKSVPLTIVGIPGITIFVPITLPGLLGATSFFFEVLFYEHFFAATSNLPTASIVSFFASNVGTIFYSYCVHSITSSRIRICSPTKFHNPYFSIAN